jgi:hypothetical protein
VGEARVAVAVVEANDGDGVRVLAPEDRLPGDKR